LQGLLHPGFCDVGVVKSHNSQLDFVSNLRGFRPKAAKRGNVISDSMSKSMEQAKQDAVLPAMLLAQADAGGLEQVWGGSSSSAKASKGKKRPRDEAAKPSQKDGPRLSKAQRKALKGGGQPSNPVGKGSKSDDKEFDGWEVKVDGVDVGGENSKGGAPSSTQPAKAKQFYLSVERDKTQDAKERGLEMEQYQVDLVPDDDKSIKKAKSVMRWDAKKKKFLPVMVAADGRVAKTQRRNEAGKKVSGEAERTDQYKRWARTTKKRIQKIGELEEETARPGVKNKEASLDPDAAAKENSLEFDEAGSIVKEEKKKKPVVPFFGNIEEKYLTHKQKRQLATRKKAEDGIVTGRTKKELKTTQQMMLDKKKRLENKVKQNPKLRKQKSKEYKEKHAKKLADRQASMTWQAKSKMIIIEGGGPAKKKFDRRRNFLTGAI